MAYSSDIATLLTAQLEKFVTLNRHQLAGQVANLDFWLAEVEHALAVLDGYQARFERMKAAQAAYVEEHRTVEFILDRPYARGVVMSPTRAPDSQFEAARRSLCEAAYRFLVRGFKEGFLEEAALRRACDRLRIGVEASDLASRA